jgi:hypothetical protein
MRDVLNARDAPLSEAQIAFVCRESLQARAFASLFALLFALSLLRLLKRLRRRGWRTCTRSTRCTATSSAPTSS